MDSIIIAKKPVTHFSHQISYLYRKDKLPQEQRFSMLSSTETDWAILQYKKMSQLYANQRKIQAHHFVQSMSEDIKDKRIAHEMGKELVQKIHEHYPAYAIHMATHTDTDNLHNHIVIENLNLEDGNAFYNNKDFLYDLRRWNDEIAKEYGLTQRGYKEQYHEKDFELDSSMREKTKVKIEKVKKKSHNFTEFKEQLETEGISIFYYDQGKKIGYSWKNEDFAIKENKLGSEKYGYKALCDSFHLSYEIHHSIQETNKHIDTAMKKLEEINNDEERKQKQAELEFEQTNQKIKRIQRAREYGLDL